MQQNQNIKPKYKNKLETEALKRLASSFIISNFKGYAQFCEKAVVAKWPPNAEGAERQRRKQTSPARQMMSLIWNLVQNWHPGPQQSTQCPL